MDFVVHFWCNFNDNISLFYLQDGRKPVRTRSEEQLPALPSLPSNLQPVVMVSVDAEKEKLHVQQFSQSSRRSQMVQSHQQGGCSAQTGTGRWEQALNIDNSYKSVSQGKMNFGTISA